MKAEVTTPPAVTVLMSVHNGERFLREAVDSILGQPFHDFELLVFDDCSIDRSLSILRSYEVADSRVRVIANLHNLGLTRTLNQGLFMARGKYVARMDADDVSLPARLEKQVAYLERHPNVAVLGACAQTIDENSRPLGMVSVPHDTEVIRQRLLHHNCLVHPSVMLRTNVIRAAGGYSESLRHAQDYELWLRLSDKTSLANLPEVLVQYRVHPGQISARKLVVQWRTAEACRTSAIRRLNASGANVPGNVRASRTVAEKLTASPGTLGATLLYWGRMYQAMGSMHRLSDCCGCVSSAAPYPKRLGDVCCPRSPKLALHLQSYETWFVGCGRPALRRLTHRSKAGWKANPS